MPSSAIKIWMLNEIGPDEIGDNYLYIPVALFDKVRKLLSSSIDLQQLKRPCKDAGATKLFNAILCDMSTYDQVAGRMHLNEKKAVTIIYMLVFGQSQKANWFQKAQSREVVTKGISMVSDWSQKLELASRSLPKSVILQRFLKIMID